MKQLSNASVIFRIALIIVISEFSLMIVLNRFAAELRPLAAAAIDAISLIVITTPLIFIFVGRPFIRARDESLQLLQELANTDPLTGLANRRMLIDQLEKAVSLCARQKCYGALLIVDLDGFKQLNDQYGHDAGDELLIELAHRLKRSTRTEDIIGRLGGDEFVLLTGNISRKEQEAISKCYRLAENLLKAIATPIALKGTFISLRASIGIRLLIPQHEQALTIYQQADAAMYRAKTEGKNCAILFNHPAKDQTAEHSR